MRSAWRRVATVLSCACVFQFAGCNLGDLDQQLQETLSNNVKSTIVEIGTIMLEAAVDSRF